jgi:class 3 adenylate cyclase
MEKFSEIVMERSNNLLDKVRVYEVKIQSCIPLNKPMKVIHTTLPLLKELGVDLPANPKKIHILSALIKNKLLLLGKSREDFLGLPEMTSLEKKAAMRFLAYLDNATYNCLPELFPITVFKRVELSVKYGNSPVSASAYAMYGTILSGFLGQYDKGYEFGRLSMELLEKIELNEFKARTFFYFNSFVRHWKEPIKNVLQPLKDAYHLGIETGDLEISSLAALLYSGYAYLVGTELTELDREMAILNQGMSSFKQETVAMAQTMWWQTVLNLKDDVDEPWILRGEACDEDEILKIFTESNTAAPLFQTSLSKIILYFLFDKNTEALTLLPTAPKYIHGAMGMCMIPMLYFYDSLVRLGLYASAKKSEKRKILRTVNKNQKKIKKWMRHSPANYTNNFYLVEAEKMRVLNKPLSAMNYYDKAVSAAQQNGFIHEEALANELAAKFYLNRDKEKIAQTYLLEARYCYLNWGATSKVRQLEKKYPQFLQKRNKASITTTKTSTETEVSFVDVATILKASQVISGEIVLEKLLRQMMQVVIQNAGAQKGYLVLRKNGKWCIEAEGDVDTQNVDVLQSIPLDTSNKIPTSIINYVTRIQESIVLDDATQKGNFTRDPYILKNHPKSILCIPLINQGNLTGILYMENNLTVGAFTPERIEVLNLLSSQMAISIENASLYKNMTDLNIAYERFVPREFLSFLQKESITDVKLGENTQKEMTILFSDIRDFTTLSEQMTPQENFKFINSYLGRMEPIIGKYSGFIDKYIGDAIMALFPTSSDDALTGAINMLRTLTEYNAGRRRAGYVPIRIGIGLNTGSLMLGTIGGLHRMDGTVISDAVNVASRVQDMTKKYGTPLLITESTYSRLKDVNQYKIRMVDKVKAKGKTESVTIYEVFDADLPEVIDLKLNSLEDLEQGFLFYYQKEFPKAKQFFEDVLKFNQEDKIAQIYQHRCDQNIKNGVADDWDGVETLLRK